MSFADEHAPDPPVGTASAITVEPAGQGVQVCYTRDGAMMMKVWVARGVARRMEGDLDDAIPLMEAKENVAVYSRVIDLFRDVMRGRPGGTVELPGDMPGSLLHRLLH